VARKHRHLSVRSAASALAAVAALTLAAGCGGIKERDANLVAGKQLFVAKCGSCHVLGRADTKGTSGPDLDSAFRRALVDGMNRDTIRGVVRGQIEYPPRGAAMPAKLVTDEKADDVAAYVASVAARGGKDAGLLATAVKQAGAGKPAVARGGTLDIDSDPSGQLAYVTTRASAPAGALTIRSRNASSIPHNIALDGGPLGKVVQGGGISEIKVDLKAGTYTFYCSVAGHRQGGMQGRLTVK
jgi:mono/diheme cytochrome c family protein